MRVLVAYATTTGSTAEIAGWIADEFRATGLPVEVHPAHDITDIGRYSAIVLGGALYAAGWHHDARQFAHRFAGQCGQRPVWLFSSGPLDTSADESDLPPTPQVVEAMRALAARGQVTFGGRLSEQTRGWLGFLSRRMVRSGMDGDFRNPARVRDWARRIAAEISASALDANGAAAPVVPQAGVSQAGAVETVRRD